jgi:hypothetical protein
MPLGACCKSVCCAVVPRHPYSGAVGISRVFSSLVLYMYIMAPAPLLGDGVVSGWG